MSLAASAASARVAAALALSAGLHAAVLTGLPGDGNGDGGAAEARDALNVRLVAQASSSALPLRPTRSDAPRPAAKAANQRSGALPEPRYLHASELSSRPVPLGNIEPQPSTAAASVSGRVVARVLINESGSADRVVIESANPPGVFDDSVVSAFGTARYRPGMLAGRAVKSQMLVEVTFHEAQAAPDARSKP